MNYSDEVWTGIEYQVAAHMIYEGMIEEAYAIVKGARDRYDGIPRPPIGRNPWNEIECGGHYARAMSSWSLLLAASGYEYDGTAKNLRFTPRVTPENFKAFFSGPEGWGSLRQVREGDCAAERNPGCRRTIGSRAIAPDAAGGRTRSKGNARRCSRRSGLQSRARRAAPVMFAAAVLVKAGEMLAVTLS